MKKYLLILLAFAAVSCSDSALQSKNPKLDPYEPPAESEKVSDVGEISKESFRPALDILFVIDNSGSMETHQQRLAANIGLFTDAIFKAKFLDYHIGVTNSSGPTSGGFFSSPTTECCGNLLGQPTYVERNTPNGIKALASNLLVGTSSGTAEMFFGPIIWALDNNPNNVGFLRQDAYLAVIVITDTEDQSDAMYDAQSTYDFLKQIKGSADKVFVGGVHIDDSEIKTCQGETTEIQTLDRLSYFFQISNAMTFSLCDPDYGTKLAEIGKLLASKAQTLYLKKIPKAGTLSVTMAGSPLPNDPKKGWTYNPVANSLEFGREIDWSTFPDNTYPVVNFESLPISSSEKKKH